jgi:glutamate-ammonia-ligase adenylyltransferase
LRRLPRYNPHMAVPDSPDIRAALAASSDPGTAAALLERWLDAGGILSSDATEIQFLKLLCILFAATPALSEYIVRFPDRARPILSPVLARQISGGPAWSEALDERLRVATTPAAQLAVLRRVRVESMLQIAALDLTGISPVADTVRALSDLADACIDAALKYAIGRVRSGRSSRRITPLDPNAGNDAFPFVVFALGKLGGRELNYSSDVDLVFAYSDSGPQSSVPPLYTAVAEELIAALDKVTEDGRVYRVDMRLRPHGTAGALVRSLAETRNYFQTEGRTWERQAWLKARVIAGDRELGGAFLEELTPFIYRKYLSLDAISDMKALKRQMELSGQRRGGDEVKLGKGGIRDIEFAVQFMQLLHGSEYPRLRVTNTLKALDELRREGLLDDREGEFLVQAYMFLRNVEHRLQLHGDQQVHWLPNDPVIRRRVALSMGYTDQGRPAVPPQALSEESVVRAGNSAGQSSGLRTAVNTASAQEAFDADLQRHSNVTRNIFQRLFANLFPESEGQDGELSDLLLAPETDLARISTLLPLFGFHQVEASARELIELSREPLALMAPSRTRKFFASLAPALLKALVSTGEPDDALRRFSRIAGSLGAKAVFYQMLHENPWLLRMTVDLAAWSEYLTDILVANPGLFDELVDALRTEQSKSAADMSGELARITSGGDISDTLRAYRAGELLRIGVRDLLHSASLEQTQFELSDLAECILRVQVQHSIKELTAARGEVLNPAGKPVAYAVLALGKFGGREMNYGSDLDVIYFYGEDGQTAAGLPAVTYFAELSQALTRAMGRRTALGALYELDARLRPNGNKGPLALSLEDFKKYWREGQLADWERLALTRARFVAGDEGVGERALHVIRTAVYSPLKDTRALSKEVVDMRRRLEENAEEGDLKRGRGGIMDIEFVVQYMQLIYGPAFPPLRQANTEVALKQLVNFKKIAVTDGTALLHAYEFLRRIENRVRVVHGLSAHRLPHTPSAVRKLALRAGFIDSAEGPAEMQLQSEFARHTRNARAIFETVLSITK